MLQLSHNQITKIKGLEKLIDLERLFLNNNGIIEIKGLTKQTKLKHLDLGNDQRYGPYNRITEIKGLETLTKLRKLNLNNNDIEEIRGLDTLKKLKELNLSGNRIREIKGLDTIINLQKLDLRKNNPIKEIKGLYNLKNLQELYISRFGFDYNIVQELGGIDKNMKVNNPQKFIDYSHPKKVKERYEKKEKKRLEIEKIRKERREARKKERERFEAERKEKERLGKIKAKKFILDSGTRFPRLQVAEIAEECELNNLELIEVIIEKMIENKEIYAKYFKSTKTIAFDQEANIDEIDNLMKAYREWEDKKVEKK